MNIIDPLAKLMGEWSATTSIGSIFLKIGIALLLSAILGIERASKRHSAGLRTFIIVMLAGTIAGMMDIFFVESFGFKVVLLGVGVIVGLGILSTNSILFTSKNQIRGLTTAITLWTAGIIGISIGIGFYTVALVVWVILVVCIAFLPALELYLKNRSNHFEIHLELESKTKLPEFVTTIRKLGLRIDDIELNNAYINSGLSVYSVSLTIISPELKKYKTHAEIIQAIESLEYVHHIEEMN